MCQRRKLRIIFVVVVKINMSDMRLSYPLEIPPGRVGMQPQLGVSYSRVGWANTN